MSTVSIGPRSRVDVRYAYKRSAVPDGIRLRLDANEGAAPSMAAILGALADAGADAIRRYPDTGPLEATLAQRFGVDRSQVLVGAGADEILDRCCRAFLAPDGALLIAAPGFEMFRHYAALCGANVRQARWEPGPYPIADMLDLVNERAAIIALVTPNNPTGEVATADDLRRLSDAAAGALVVLDHAYVDFADEDLTRVALTMPNVVVVRTFSKAWGLAGCRVGYALGPAPIINVLRASGGPFPASALSLAIAGSQFETAGPARDAYVARVRDERRELYDALSRLRANPRTSQANFVFAELGERSLPVHAALVEQGILVRLIRSDGQPLGLRITLPGNPEQFAVLVDALNVALTQGQEP